MATSPGSRKIVHPLYADFAKSWEMALDVYEGGGGFLDPRRPYLQAHPREWLDHSIKDATTGITSPNPNPSKPSPKLTARRRLARYENIAATILDAVSGALFMQHPSRTFGEHKANETVSAWWKDVDGKRTHIDTFMQDSWVVAGVFGYAVLFLDKAATEAETAADVAPPRLCRYTPLDMIDWITDEQGKLVSVKLVEPEPRKDFGTRMTATQLRVRVVDETSWELFDSKGVSIEKGEHGFGRLPITLLYGKRRPLIPIIGKSVIGDPQLFIDLYNLTSEVRELLRNQTFSILNVPIGKDGSVETEQARIGSQSGTANVMFSGEAAHYLEPSGTNVTVYHDHIDRLARMIYRLASMPWEGDSKDAESADSRQIKRAELSQVLTKYAAELQSSDRDVLELVYRATYGDKGQAQLEADGATVTYPTEFDAPDLQAIAEHTAAALALDLGPTATKELKKRTVRQFLPGMETDKLKASDAEIDGQQILTKDEKAQAIFQGQLGRMQAGAESDEPEQPVEAPPPAKDDESQAA